MPDKTPEKMKAAIINRYGRSGVIEVTEIARPVPGPDEVLVRVVAASLNPRDWLTMRGIYQMKRVVEPFPITLGSDFAGDIVETGFSVKDFEVGDAVFGMQPLKGKFGAFAQYVKIKASAIAKKPDGISYEDAAAMPCAGFTSYQTLVDIAKVKPGEHVLIAGASGGVGVYAVQIAKAMGAHVTAVCGPDNGELCRSLGADEIINHREEHFEDRRDAFDVVYDVIGRSDPRKSERCMRAGARYITTIPKLATVRMAMRSWLLSKLLPGRRKTAHLILVKPHPKDLTAMADMIVAGTMKSVIDSRYSLNDIEQAFERSQTWRARGKIIVNVAEPNQ